jgi:hypothetical protein
MDFLYQYLNYTKLQDLPTKYGQRLLTNLKSDNVINILNYIRFGFKDYMPVIQSNLAEGNV